MKKRLRLAAALSGAAMFCGTMAVNQVSAEIWTMVGSETEEKDMKLLDDKGLFNLSGEDSHYQVYMQYCTDYHDDEVTDPETGEIKIERIYNDSCRVNVITPIMDSIWFVLRSDLPDAEQKMLEILDQYYPEISETFTQRVPNENASISPMFYILNDGSSTGPYMYELRDLTGSAGSAERSDSILHDLADAGLISEYYTWGQGAYFQQYFGWLSYAEDGFDKEKVEGWLAVHAPNCSLKENHYENDQLKWRDYQIIPDESLSFEAQFALVAEIYEATGIRPAIYSFDDVQQTFAKNSLLQKGDVNLDCEIGLSDAVLLAKAAAGAGNGLTAAGRQNAELDGAEGISAGDLTALLRYLAGASDTL